MIRTSRVGQLRITRVTRPRSAALMNRPRGTAPEMRVALAGLPHRRRVDDRQHLGEVVDDQPVEEPFVSGLERDSA
jgi:hypothetical protein